LSKTSIIPTAVRAFAHSWKSEQHTTSENTSPY
jgi:hypothetical protein